MIFPIWKKIGESTHQLAHQCGISLGEPATHTGTLDPMASGVIVIATGSDRFVKGKLSDWRKTYEFTILWGVSTDSLDALGLLTSLQTSQSITIENFISRLSAVTLLNKQDYKQEIPNFSARRIGGQSSFEVAKTGGVVPKKTRLVSLFSHKLLSYSQISVTDLLKAHREKIATIQGDFRQEAILLDWQNKLINAHDSQLMVTVHEISTSPGFYVRQLIHDIAKTMHTPALAWEICRTKNGPYTKLDCSEVIDLAF